MVGQSERLPMMMATGAAGFGVDDWLKPTPPEKAVSIGGRFRCG
jgi:hypothetical protein